MTVIENRTPATPADDSAPYIAPRIELVKAPRTLTTFDGFTISGSVLGSEVEGAEVEVSVAGVTRTGTVSDGAWAVSFEAGALCHQHAGVRPITGRVTDGWFNTAQSTHWVTIDEFVDGYVYVDARHEIDESAGSDGELIASGELGLGTHEHGRSLEVALVRDGDEEVSVATGRVDPGWHHGEWMAHLPLNSVCPGTYRVRARLVDGVSAVLTRQTLGRPVTLG